MTTDNVIELTRIAARDGGALLCFFVRITEGGTTREEMLTAFAARMELLPKTGPLSETILEALVLEDQYTKALHAGLRVLGAASTSRMQLVQKLCQRGVKKEVAAEVAEELWSRGFGNEIEGALSVARRDLAKLWGDRRILLDVRAKGYEGEAIEAVRALLDDENSMARLERLISKRYRKDVAEGERERLVAALVRYGYTPREIKAALRDE